MKYGQFCPIAKATELLGEKWTFLILRELLMGSSRFNEIQRGLCLVSPALLTRRLKTLEENGLLVRRKIPGQRGYEYFPTEATQELLPILLELGEWGLRWAKDYLTDEDYDVEFLLHYLRLSILPEKLPGNETVLKFKFQDIEDNPDWWIIVSGSDVDICIKDPGKDVDIYFTTKVKTMSQVWMGQRTYKDAIQRNDMTIVGPSALTRNITSWLTCSPFSKLEDQSVFAE